MEQGLQACYANKIQGSLAFLLVIQRNPKTFLSSPKIFLTKNLVLRIACYKKLRTSSYSHALLIDCLVFVWKVKALICMQQNHITFFSIGLGPFCHKDQDESLHQKITS